MKKWKIVYETYCKAVDQVYATVQSYLGYHLVCDMVLEEEKNIIYIGIDPNLEGYRIKVWPAERENQRIEIQGKDIIHLLYAASDFRNIYLPYARYSNVHSPVYYLHDLFTAPMKEYELVTKPRIKHRGIWTWGYVIYDYKKYIDNMVTLKLNTLIVWNDYLPANIREVIDYAHENGVQIYLGFAWGWDTDCKGCGTILQTESLKGAIVETYRSWYEKLDCDGIYFQSFTELGDDHIDGIDVAEAVTKFVNVVGDSLLAIKSDLKLLFGLHATSVKNRLHVIRNVDPRIAIIWEDLGAFPYDYMPCKVEGFEETIELTRAVQNLRESGFGAVLKGLFCLDWTTFVHQEGQYVLGKADEAFLKRKVEEKKEILRYVQAYWIRNAKYAHEMMKEFREDDMITVLAEDGMVEEIINYPLALYAQMMWDSNRSLEEILSETALMTDVTFV